MRLRRSPMLLLLVIASVWTVIVLHASAQTASGRQTNSAAGFRIAGMIVSKTDGHPISRAQVVLTNTKGGEKPWSVTTSDDGKLEFDGIPAGKYSLTGTKRGFISASYDQHEQFSTAIVTGADVDTENLILKLDPESTISGKVLDEVGEPVRDATVTLYRDSHQEGTHQVQTSRGTQTNDLGEFEIAELMPGTYFLSASAQPWYAVHPESETGHSSATFDPSLDVTYPLTYYGDVTEPDSATPISVHGAEHLQLDLHLNPVPSLRVIIHVPKSGNNDFPFPQFEQPGFDGAIPVQRSENRMISPGTWEISGIPAGRYDIRLMGRTGGAQINGVELSSTSHEVDASNGEPMCSIRVSVSFGDANISGRYAVMLRTKNFRTSPIIGLNSKGGGEFENLPPGSYEVSVLGPGRFALGRISAEGATVSGHTVTLAAGSSASLSITAVTGTAEVKGVAKRSDKAFAGAMVVLVPRNPENNHDLFRRDQSDLDGTFTFYNVYPGTYTVVAIQDGWDLDWSQRDVIAGYAKHGVPLQVGDKAAQNMSLPAAVEVQSK